MKHIKGSWIIVKNTDTVDIDEKCLGLSVQTQSELNKNRGLHIQIRHNRDQETYEAANNVASLLASAPKMLEVLESLVEKFKPNQGIEIKASEIADIQTLIRKAKGE